MLVNVSGQVRPDGLLVESIIFCFFTYSRMSPSLKLLCNGMSGLSSTRRSSDHDITDRKKAENELKRYRDNLEKLVSERTIDLQMALDEIKTLKGIVPICSTCKKIRDDNGYWNKLESYIQKHSEASFSHGMCPDCSDKLYGNEGWYIEMKKEREQKK